MDDWLAEEIAAHKKPPLRRCISSFGFNIGSSSAGIREAKSFTGALQELKTNKQYSQQLDPNYYMKIYTEHQLPIKCSEYITKEVSSDKTFIVNQEMLRYQGKQYSLSDIATRWKKDCRMWLWKGINKRSKSVSELREKMQALKMPTSSENFKHIV